MNIHWSAMREIYEELYNGEAVRRHDSRRLKHDCYFSLNSGLQFFRDNEDSFGVELLSFGINALGGNFEQALLLLVRDTSFWNRFGNEIQANWEAESILQLSTRDSSKILMLLSKETWASEGLFHITQGLRRLAEVVPNRVALPELRVELD